MVQRRVSPRGAKLFPLVLATVLLGWGLATAIPAYADDRGPPATFGDKLKISIDKSKVDLKQHRLEIVLSREASILKLKVTGESGTVLADDQVDLTGKRAGTPIALSWAPPSDEATAKVGLRVEDSAGNWAAVEVWTWSVSVPHKEVNFKTGSSRIEDSEKAKLEESYALIADSVAKAVNLGADLGRVTLFVAGHTDTVGTTADNFRLSRERARAIAGWFRGRGLTIHIAYEGFGEAALLVKTADNVDEPRNRRADYILGFDEPAITAMGFRPTWQRIQ